MKVYISFEDIDDGVSLRLESADGSDLSSVEEPSEGLKMAAVWVNTILNYYGERTTDIVIH